MAILRQELLWGKQQSFLQKVKLAQVYRQICSVYLNIDFKIRYPAINSIVHVALGFQITTFKNDMIAHSKKLFTF